MKGHLLPRRAALIGTALAAIVIALPAAAQAEVSPQLRAERIRIEASQGKTSQASEPDRFPRRPS